MLANLHWSMCVQPSLQPNDEENKHMHSKRKTVHLVGEEHPPRRLSKCLEAFVAQHESDRTKGECCTACHCYSNTIGAGSLESRLIYVYISICHAFQQHALNCRLDFVIAECAVTSTCSKFKNHLTKLWPMIWWRLHGGYTAVTKSKYSTNLPPGCVKSRSSGSLEVQAVGSCSLYLSLTQDLRPDLRCRAADLTSQIETTSIAGTKFKMGLTAIAFILLPVCVFSALPPGYEDILLCPCDFCKNNKEQEPGFAGYATAIKKLETNSWISLQFCYFTLRAIWTCRPISMFWECKSRDGKTLAVTTWGTIVSTHEELDELHKGGYHELECGSSSTYACTSKLLTAGSVVEI